MATLLAENLELGNEPLHGAGTIGELTSNEALIESPQLTANAFMAQLSVIIGFITIVGGLFFLMYFFIAAFDWLRAGGDKGDVEKAQHRMTNGAIGLFVMVMAIGIIGIVGSVLGIELLNPAEMFVEIVNSRGGQQGPTVPGQ